MAAYAALVSLMHIVEQIQHHPYPPISFDKEQVESLTRSVTYLQEFLEGYSHVLEQADALEIRIANAAYAAEDVIESHIVDQIHGGSTSDPEKLSSADLCEGLWKVVEFMDLIKKDVMEMMRERMGIKDQMQRCLSISAGSSRSPSTGQNTAMVGLDDALNEVLDKLTGQQGNLQITPIVGMGGMGKTTLARIIYANALVVEHFDVRAWVTISQVYRMLDILLQLLLCQTNKWSKEDLSKKSEDELGIMFYQYLSGRRYLIVIDDIWSIEVWDNLKFLFPDNSNGSRIMMTTRLSNLAFLLSDSYNFRMKFLDEDNSWDLFRQIVFGKEVCPVELEEIGKKIVKNCKGLPLSIVVIGGLLTKKKGFIEYWEYTLGNLSSAINLGDDERCLQILYTSYVDLPMHLKPCFLYMGIFAEATEIRVSELVKLWVAEGFLKSIDGKSLEVVADEYFTELIDRNLILVHQLGSNGKIKFCKIHDLLRDLCIRQAQKQIFFCVTSLRDLNSSRCIKTERRIVIHRSMLDDNFDPSQVVNALQSASLARSLFVDYKSYDFEAVLQSANLRLLRVFKVNYERLYYGSFCLDYKLYNLRYFSSNCIRNPVLLSPHLYWNLQTLIHEDSHHSEFSRITFGESYDFSEFWKMPLLRHVKLHISCIPDPPSSHIDGRDDFTLVNLQTLLQIRLSACHPQVFERNSNVEKLKIFCGEDDRQSLHFLNNLGFLHKLEDLNCVFLLLQQLTRSVLLQNLTFPYSLKKLTLCGCLLDWEDITTKIGPLPLLEVLKLKCHSFSGPEWVTVEGQFCSLKFLLIDRCTSLEYWTTDSTHFPRLEHLVLSELHEMEEIPSCIGEIPTLQSIKLSFCSDSLMTSAKRILEEQVELGIEGLQVEISHIYDVTSTAVSIFHWSS